MLAYDSKKCSRFSDEHIGPRFVISRAGKFEGSRLKVCRAYFRIWKDMAMGEKRRKKNRLLLSTSA
jgi:hypothetical protein